MQIVNFLEAIRYSDENIIFTVMAETAHCKEIRITMQKNQVMRDHATADPVSISVLEGMIKLTVEEQEYILNRGKVATLDADAMHHLEALENTVLRLTILTGSR